MLQANVTAHDAHYSSEAGASGPQASGPQKVFRRSEEAARFLALGVGVFGILGALAFILDRVGVPLGAFTPPPSPPLVLAALGLIALAILFFDPRRRSSLTFWLAVTALIMATARVVLFLVGTLPTPVFLGNLLTTYLLAGSVIFLAKGRAAAAQASALLAAVIPFVFAIDFAYGVHPYGTLLLALLASQMLAAVAIILLSAKDGPARHLLMPDPAGRLARLRVIILSLATIVLGSFAVRLNFNADVVPIIVAGGLAASIAVVTDITGYLRRSNRAMLAHGLPPVDEPLVADLDFALANDQFTLLFQPQIDLVTGRLAGVEALVRWIHPRRGIVMPADFVPTAEASSRILPLGEWILRRACLQGVRWRGTVLDGLTISVNMSPLQLQSPDFASSVRGILAETGFPPERLVLELTESALVRRGDPGFQGLWDLHKTGVTIAVDDFGTGYSCLAYLYDLPVNALKIDQSFVGAVPGHKGAEAIVRTIVGMGRGLGLTIIAEGVESSAQAEFLRGIWCNEGQGYLYSEPLDEERVVQWASAWPGFQRPAVAGPQRLA